MDELSALVDRVCADHPDDPWKALVDTGLSRVGVAESAGGSGGALPEAAAVVSALAANAAPVPVAEQAILAGWLAERAGLRLPAGMVAVAWEHQRPGAVRMVADRRGWILQGQVAGIPWGRRANHLVTVARADADVVVALLPTTTPRVSVRAGTNLAGEPRDEVTFAGARPAHAVAVPASVLDELSLRGALARTLQIAGALRRVLSMTLRYAAERHQFGRPLARMDPVRQQVALLAGEVSATTAGADAAVATLAAATPPEAATLAVAAAKIQAGVAATAGARLAHQVHGAIGFTMEHPLHRYTTRLWSWRDEYGNDEHWARNLSRIVHAHGDDLWAALTVA